MPVVKEKCYGMAGQISLSYDMTFLAMLLSGLYEPEETCSRERCVAHPLSRHMAIENIFTEYAADMNVLLTMYKCEDDWQDEKKFGRHLYGSVLKVKSIKKNPYSEKAEKDQSLSGKSFAERKGKCPGYRYDVGAFW